MSVLIQNALTYKIESAEKFLDNETRLLWPSEFYKGMLIARASFNSFYSFVLRSDLHPGKGFRDENTIFKNNFERAYSREKLLINSFSVSPSKYIYVANFKNKDDSDSSINNSINPEIESEKVIPFNDQLDILFKFEKYELFQGRTYEIRNLNLRSRIQKTFIRDVHSIKDENEINKIFMEKYLI